MENEFKTLHQTLKQFFFILHKSTTLLVLLISLIIHCHSLLSFPTLQTGEFHRCSGQNFGNHRSLEVEHQKLQTSPKNESFKCIPFSS